MVEHPNERKFFPVVGSNELFRRCIRWALQRQLYEDSMPDSDIRYRAPASELNWVVIVKRVEKKRRMGQTRFAPIAVRFDALIRGSRRERGWASASEAQRRFGCRSQ